MVNLYSIIIMNYQKSAPYILYSLFELSSIDFFARSVTKELCIFASTESIKRSAPGRKTSLEYKSIICYVQKNHDGIAVACTCDTEYPVMIAFEFLSNVLNNYQDNKISESSLKNLLYEYQDINKINKIYAIKKELAETVKICSDTINKLAIREDELQDLIQRTQDLSEQTKIFMIESKNLNSCCTLF